MTVGPRSEGGIASSFTSLLTAQVIGAGLGLVFWVVIARSVATEQVGMGAAAITTQTLLGSIASLGVGTLLISELPLLRGPAQRRLLLRGLGAVVVVSLLVGSAFAAAAPLLGRTLGAAVSAPAEAVVFTLGVAAAASALVVDQAGLGMKKARVQVVRNLFASSMRFPLAALLLTVGPRSSIVLQLCWVLPLAASVVLSLFRLRLGPRGTTSAPLRDDLASYAPLALRNHALNLSLAAGTQLVPVVAALVLSRVDNASFAVAWLLAGFAFLPPYLLATALFAHGANASAEQFRETMRTTVPAALTLSAGLCVGAWFLGRPVLMIFGDHYSENSAMLLSLLVPAGLWMVVKDHLVAFWRSQRRYRLGVAMSLAALSLEMAGAAVGGFLSGAQGLCVGWLVGIAVEMLLFLPVLRSTFSGLRWKSPLRLLDRRSG